jgi:hypothetical protein
LGNALVVNVGNFPYFEGGEIFKEEAEAETMRSTVLLKTVPAVYDYTQ